MPMKPKITTYSAGDYAGLETEYFKAYYGYERTDQDDNWCFVATFNGIEIVIPNTKLPVKDKSDCTECLLIGIGMVLSEFEMGNRKSRTL